jgi:hypothetical protein
MRKPKIPILANRIALCNGVDTHVQISAAKQLGSGPIQLSPDERAAYGLQPNPVAGDFSPKPYKKKSWLDD